VNRKVKKRISESTIRRLSLYLRDLSVLEKEGVDSVSSKELASREKLTPAQVRKDLSFFGSFDTRGLGYPVNELRAQITAILEIDRVWRKKRISESTIRRLSLYLRDLSVLEKEGVDTVSSKELASREKLTPAQVRKDLSFFGSFGTRGLGYPVNELRARITAILGIDRVWRVGLFGAGNIGSALVGYKEFARQGFKIVKLFDNDQRKIGSNRKGIVISDIRNMEQEVKKAGIEMAIIAVPATVAQHIVNDVVAVGIKAILNFAPISLKVPEDVYLRNENMSMELEYLSFAMVNKHTEKRSKF
jgi:redox-sensing transcriptional repressor